MCMIAWVCARAYECKRESKNEWVTFLLWLFNETKAYFSYWTRYLRLPLSLSSIKSPCDEWPTMCKSYFICAFSVYTSIKIPYKSESESEETLHVNNNLFLTTHSHINPHQQASKFRYPILLHSIHFSLQCHNQVTFPNQKKRVNNKITDLANF